MIARIESWRGEYEGMPLPVALRILLDLGLKTPPSALRRKDLIDPKDPDGTYVAPRSYKPKVEGGKSIVEWAKRRMRRRRRLPELPEDAGAPRSASRTMSPDAIREMADRAERGR
jgi:hypothetical protein